MADIIALSDLTLNPEEARSTAQMVFEDKLVKPNSISEVHDILTDVDMDRFIPILGNFGLVGKLDPGTCGVNLEAGGIPVSEKKWTPKLISFRIAICESMFPDLFKAWKKEKIAANIWEKINSEAMAFINDKVGDAVFSSILRFAEFGDLTASPFGDGTGNQTLTVGIAKTYFNVLDGIWAQIIADQAGAKLSYRYAIDENGAATKAEQLILGTDTAIKALRAMYNNIDPRAFAKGNLKIQITRSLMNNYIDFMEDKSLVFTLQNAEKGSTSMSYRGIPLVVRSDWDNTIASYFDNGTTLYLPHRALMTTNSNIPIGTSDSQSLSMLTSFYVQKDKTNYIDVAYKLDAKVLQEEIIAVAY